MLDSANMFCGGSSVDASAYSTDRRSSGNTFETFPST